MQREIFNVLAEAKTLEDLQRIEPKAREVRKKYFEGLKSVAVGELAIHRRVSRLKYSRRCAEASAVQAYIKQGLPLAPEMEISYVMKDAKKWEVDPARTASEFDAGYYGGFWRRLGRRRSLSLDIDFEGNRSIARST